MHTERLNLERSELLEIIVDGVEIDDAPVWIEIDAEVFLSDETETGGRRNEIFINWIKTKYQVTLDLETCQEALGHSNNEFEITADQLVTRPDFVEILREHFENMNE
jgi:hypothetical protein